jgi:hypothetical protein
LHRPVAPAGACPAAAACPALTGPKNKTGAIASAARVTFCIPFISFSFYRLEFEISQHGAESQGFS